MTDKLASDVKCHSNPQISVGLSLQAGVDYHFDQKWFLNASVRWIDIDTEAEVKFDSGSKLAVDLEIDPLVYTFSVGYKF